MQNSSKNSLIVSKCHKIRSQEKNTMTPRIRKSRPTSYENQISLIKFEFLKIIHVPVTFSRLTNTDTRICTGTFMLNGQKIAQNSKLEEYVSGQILY